MFLQIYSKISSPLPYLVAAPFWPLFSYSWSLELSLRNQHLQSRQRQVSTSDWLPRLCSASNRLLIWKHFIIWASMVFHRNILVFGSSLTEVSNILNEVVITDKFPGTFQFFFGNIGTKDMPKDYQYGWAKLTNKTSIEEYFSIFQSVSDLIYKASMLYRDENKVKHYVHLQPKILRLSYPVGSCLRYIY